MALVVISPRVCGEIRLLAVTTSAGFAPGLPGPGSPATIFCTGLNIADANSITVTYPDSFRAPIYGTADLGAYQIVNFQVPWENHGGPPSLSQGSNSLPIVAAPAAWGEFFTTQDGFAIALHAIDFSLVTPQNPAQPAEWIVLYGSNFGDVVGPPATGSPAPLDPLAPLDPGGPVGWTFTAWLIDPTGNRQLTTNFFGLAPGLTGVYQINVHMPDTLPANILQIYMQRTRDCGFFFKQGCGRGLLLDISATAHVP
jgi:uncharacterized protein (TIGR03437 family)